MDALLAFWPGLQVLLGDVRPAVETHEMLYQVMQRHTFIPEAFTSDFQVNISKKLFITWNSYYYNWWKLIFPSGINGCYNNNFYITFVYRCIGVNIRSGQSF